MTAEGSVKLFLFLVIFCSRCEPVFEASEPHVETPPKQSRPNEAMMLTKNTLHNQPITGLFSSPKAWFQSGFGFRTSQKLALQTSSPTASTMGAAGTSFLLPASPQSPESLAPHDDQKREKDGDGEEKAHTIPSDVPHHQQDARQPQQNIEGKECPSSPAVETEVSFAEATGLDLLLDGLLREDEMVMPLGYGDGVGWQAEGEGNGKNRRITRQVAAPKAGKSRGEEGCGGSKAAANAKKGDGGGDSDGEEQGGIVGRPFLTKRKGRRKGSSIDSTSKGSPPRQARRQHRTMPRLCRAISTKTFRT